MPQSWGHHLDGESDEVGDVLMLEVVLRNGLAVLTPRWNLD